MKAVSQFLLAVVAVVLIFILVGRFDEAHNANRPNDMPADAHFLASGYDLEHNEQEGDWVVCRMDAAQAANFCRVTDKRGTVVYQGDFLPLSSTMPVAEDQLTLGHNDPQRMWVQGPAEGQPVPVIMLANGERLVPMADRDALVARWNRQPEELARVSAGSR